MSRKPQAIYSDDEPAISSKYREQVSKELIEIVKKFGFVYLRNYGISRDLVDK